MTLNRFVLAWRRANRGVARLRAAVQVRLRPLDVVLIQSAAGAAATAMLAQSARTAIEYCRRHGYQRREFIGLYRGYHPWQATFSRIYMMKELLDEGFRGWVLHLDMDAIIVDLDFNLYRLIPLRPCALIICSAGTTRSIWDVNNGVFLLNLGTEDGRTLVERWYQAAMSVSDEQLRAGAAFGVPTHDQRQLHELLRDDPPFARRVVHMVSADVMNAETGRFIRHFMSKSGPMEMRTAKIKAEADAALARG